MRPLAVAVVTLLCACGAHVDHPPVIDSVVMPSMVTVGTDGTYDVIGHLSYHDDDHPVPTLRIRIPLVNMSYDVSAGNLYIGNIDPLEVKFAAQTPKGPQEYDLSVLDSVGLESAVSVQMVTLQ